MGGNPDGNHDQFHYETNAELDQHDDQDRRGEDHCRLPAWKDVPIKVSKYVNDNNLVEKVNSKLT